MERSNSLNITDPAVERRQMTMAATNEINAESIEKTAYECK
jgi:hypothetical protein